MFLLGLAIQSTAQQSSGGFNFSITPPADPMSGQMGTANITGYTGPGACAVVIPSTLDGWTVKTIESTAFPHKTLTSITIPATVTAINGSAFYYCSSMTGVYFLGNPPSLGSDVFTGANSATVYRLPTATGWGSTFGGRSVVMLAAPAVTTGTTSGITTAAATLQGTVNPNGSATTAQFEYGPTNTYGSTATVTLSPNNGPSALPVSATLSGLPSGTHYHYRLTATNSLGASTGDDATFVTLNPDITVPEVAITYPVSDGATVDSSSLSVRGTASDNIGVTAVYLRVGEAPWAAASGTTSWSGTVTLATGLNTIQMYAEDSANNHSNIVSRTVTYTPEAHFAMQVAPGPMMVGGRMGANAEVMPDGKLVVFGGHGPPGWTALTTSENLLPGAGSFTQSTTVYSHDGGFFAKMLDGRFLIGGGANRTVTVTPAANQYGRCGRSILPSSEPCLWAALATTIDFIASPPTAPAILKSSRP
jgi:hypothetical protein